MTELSYEKLARIWNYPEKSESGELWDYLAKEDYYSVQKECSNHFENLLLDEENGLYSYLMKDDIGFYNMIYQLYVRWKYTDYRNVPRYIQHANSIVDADKKLIARSVRDYVCKVKNKVIMSEDIANTDINEGLKLEKGFYGIGVAGITGILSLLLPQKFGVVDRYVAASLSGIDKYRVKCINALSYSDAVNIEWILFEKARELKNKRVGTVDWTPREIDKVLWSYRVKQG